MDFLRHLLFFGHILAIAGLIGSLLAQWNATQRPASALTVWSARLALLFGVLVVGVLEADDVDVNHAKVGVKLLIALVVVGLLEADRKKASLTQALYYAVLGLAVVNVGIAIFWR
ncbi:MAG: hypothetical protein HZY75_14655 [Nocardioidaceae bacterium]|nr:MAG: hypothetical protein HZY75_14655 [Nocardioidaceae bacterium]